MDPTTPLNHIFVDYENVQAIDLDVIGSKGVTFTLLIGAQKKKLDVELVEQLVMHAASVELVRMTASGRNALDFTLAYYVGRAVAADPSGYFHIISKDAGYDPMIRHLRSRSVRIRRHDAFSELTFSYPQKLKGPASDGALLPARDSGKAVTPTNDDPMARILMHLRKQVNNRPRRRKTLVSHLAGLLGKQSTDAGIEQLIERLVEEGSVAIDSKGAVTYRLPAAG
jgi:PIN domain